MIKFPTEYCVFDFETTGLSPDKDYIIEIGAHKVESRREDVNKSWLIKWPGVEVSEEITKITGITQQEIDEKGMDPKTAFTEFMKFAYKFHLVGHNAIKFDYPFLLSMLKRHDFGFDEKFFPPPWYIIDTAGIYKCKRLNMQQMWYENLYEYCLRGLDKFAPGVKYNLGYCCDNLGVSREGIVQHRAAADVLLTSRLYQNLCLSTNPA